MPAVYETVNSWWTIDLDNHRYMRKAKDVVGPAESERLQYGVWLPLKDVDTPVELLDDGRLHILHEDSVFGITTSKVIWMEVT